MVPTQRPTRFPRGNNSPKTRPLSDSSSIWILTDTEGDVDGSTRFHPELSEQDIFSGVESGPRNPSAGGAQVDEHEPQDRPDPLMQDSRAREENPLPQTEGKSSPSERTVRRLQEFIKSVSVNCFKIGDVAHCGRKNSFAGRCISRWRSERPARNVNSRFPAMLAG